VHTRSLICVYGSCVRHLPRSSSWFLDRVATHILAFEDDGNVAWFEVRGLSYRGGLVVSPARQAHSRLPAFPP
jgi:hypothetical protein